MSAFSEDLFVISMRFSSFVVAISFVICWSNSLSFSAKLAYSHARNGRATAKERERGNESKIYRTQFCLRFFLSVSVSSNPETRGAHNKNLNSVLTNHIYIFRLLVNVSFWQSTLSLSLSLTRRCSLPQDEEQCD